MTRKSARTNYVQNIIAILIVICGIAASFVLFYQSNVNRITHQNESYVTDIARQRASLVNDLFNENLAYIKSASIVVETAFQDDGVDARKLNVSDESQIDPAEVDKVASILREYEKRFSFDYLRFIDLYGRDYTTGEKVIAAVVTERDYYKEGIRGMTGMTYVLDSKVTSERQIGFFCPVHQGGEIVGAVVGFYGEDFINSLLDISMFDHDCDVLLCAQDGTIVYSKGDNRGVANFIEGLSEFPFEDEADPKRVLEAFSNRDDALYSYRESGLSTVGCVTYVSDASDFFLVLNFPADAYQEMLKNANGNGVSLLLSLIGIFAAAAIFFAVRFLMQKRRLIEEAKNSNDIHFAMSRLFENFVLVNAQTRTYHYIEGMPDVGHIPNDGPYDLFASDLLKRSTNENEREEAAQLISFEHLTELMNQGNDVVSYNLHVPIGEEEWFTYNFIVISREADGQVSEFIVARQDITKLQEKEEEIRRILENARIEAEKGNKAKSDFLASMSHDIRTPMNAIIGYTNIARQHLDNPDMTDEYLKKIQVSSHYLLQLINDVLDMSKIESGKVQLNENECNLIEVFGRIADMTRSQASKKNLAITYDVDGIQHPFVIADELRLEQVLINITSNAVKYTPEDGSIVIAAHEEGMLADGKCRYRFAIRDTGIGMSEDFLPHLFESFSRETTSTINKTQGTGLGMAITSRIVDLMGGEISVSSKVGEGSEFVVLLDLPVLDGSKKRESASVEKETTENVDLTGKRVLLVEDNDVNAEIAQLVLSEHGVITERAANGQEGLDMVRDKGEGYYDAVLMDIQMPVMNGFEATRAIRQLEGDYIAKLPIIAMSANAYEEDIRASLDSGMNDHIAKPFNPEDLALMLHKRIKMH